MAIAGRFAREGADPAAAAGVEAFAVFPAADEAACVTGSTCRVEGGMSHWNKGL